MSSVIPLRGFGNKVTFKVIRSNSRLIIVLMEDVHNLLDCKCETIIKASLVKHQQQPHSDESLNRMTSIMGGFIF